jgi:hypothetical protein
LQHYFICNISYTTLSLASNLLLFNLKTNIMRSFRQITTAAIVTLGIFSTVMYTSCSKSSDTPANQKYAGTYKGNGTDNSGGTYTNFSLQFTATSGSSTGMTLKVLDNTGAPAVTELTATLGTGTAYTVTASDATYTYTGGGTVDGNTASLILNEAPKAGGSPTVYTFTSMIKQ